jgi:glucosamine--fructose-6-phosphate aminotransferase (isomerizing)
MSKFLDEIYEIPGALKRLVYYYRNDGRAKISEWKNHINMQKRILFTGMGTSEFAPIYIMNRLAAIGISSINLDAGEWLHYGSGVQEENNVAVIISQSGESIEVKKLIESGKAGMQYIAITNDENSFLGKNAQLNLPLCAGDEASVSTKTYSNTLGLLYILAHALQEDCELSHVFNELDNLTDKMLDIDDKSIKGAAEFLLPGLSLVFVGRGPALVCAKQCTLTFMEGTRCVASAFSGGAFRHGPFEVVDKDFRLIIFRPEGLTDYLVDKLAENAAKLRAHVVVFTDRKKVQGDYIKEIPVKNVRSKHSEELFPMAVSVLQNLLLYHLAAARGIKEVGFRYGGKITIQE